MIDQEAILCRQSAVGGCTDVVGEDDSTNDPFIDLPSLPTSCPLDVMWQSNTVQPIQIGSFYRVVV